MVAQQTRVVSSGSIPVAPQPLERKGAIRFVELMGLADYKMSLPIACNHDRVINGHRVSPEKQDRFFEYAPAWTDRRIAWQLGKTAPQKGLSSLNK